jgi:hypothetical protein
MQMTPQKMLLGCCGELSRMLGETHGVMPLSGVAPRMCPAATELAACCEQEPDLWPARRSEAHVARLRVSVGGNACVFVRHTALTSYGWLGDARTHQHSYCSNGSADWAAWPRGPEKVRMHPGLLCHRSAHI